MQFASLKMKIDRNHYLPNASTEQDLVRFQRKKGDSKKVKR